MKLKSDPPRELTCVSCGFSWVAAPLDHYILRCGFCGNHACERCGADTHALIHLCSGCRQRHGADLEDIFVGRCGCGYIRQVGVVGAGTWAMPKCEACKKYGQPHPAPEAFSHENFKRRIENRHRPLEDAGLGEDPGDDLLPVTSEKLQAWDRSFEFDLKRRSAAQAAWHGDADSIEGLLWWFDSDPMVLPCVAPALGMMAVSASVQGSRARAALERLIFEINENPWFAAIAARSLCLAPSDGAFTAVNRIFDADHFSVTRWDCLDMLLSMEVLTPGFLFTPERAPIVRRVVSTLDGSRALPWKRYFHTALGILLAGKA